jgi:HD-GYP domain-containing protein (c-di-GMP phosphodiesterase class II)
VTAGKEWHAQPGKRPRLEFLRLHEYYLNIVKRAAFKTVTVFILMSIAVIGVIVGLEISRRNSQFRSMQVGIRTMLELQAAALNDGYFSWSEVQDLVRENEIQKAGALLKDILDIYPLVEDVALQPVDPPAEPFEVTGSNSSVRLRFSIKDDFGFNPLPGWSGIVTMDAQKLLDTMKADNRLAIVPTMGKDIGYNIMVRFVDPLLGFLDYIVIVAMALSSGLLISAWIWRRNIYFYETKGLESIIFLFEQTELLSANHSRRVAALSIFLGQLVGYKGRQLRDLYVAALLHDIGKISVPSSLLLKDGPLTGNEQQALASHPIISARILKNFKELNHLSEMVLYHHERMDGSGYPEGLSGERIPEQSRIIAVVDVFEALVGERPYRESITPAEAFDMMRKMPLDQDKVELLASSYHRFETFQAPRFVLSYHPRLEKL